MKVKELIEMLKGFENDNVLFSSDEELNTLRSDGQVATLSDRQSTLVIYGLDGSEID